MDQTEYLKQALLSGLDDEQDTSAYSAGVPLDTAVDAYTRPADDGLVQIDPNVLKQNVPDAVPSGITQQKLQSVEQTSLPKQVNTLPTGEDKKAVVAAAAVNKQESLADRDSFINTARFDTNNITLDDFINMGSGKGIDRNTLTTMYYRNKQQDAEAARDYASRQGVRAQQKTVGETFGDAALSVAKGVVGIGQAAVGIADLGALALTGGNTTISEVTGLGNKFKQTKEILNELQSENAQFNKELVQKEIAQKELLRDEQLAARAINGKNSIFDVLTIGAARSWDAVVAYAGNPSALTDSVLESSLYFIVPAGIANAVRQRALAAIPAAERAAYAASTVGKEALDKAASLAALVSISALEGSSNAMDIKTEIMNMDVTNLAETSPVFQQYVKDGLTPEQAREAVANNAFLTTFAVVGGIAYGASKLTQTDNLVGNLLEKVTGIKQSATKVGASALRETGEEYLQSFGGQLGQNIATKYQVDPNQDLLEGTFSAAGSGALSGGISAGITTTGIEAVQGTAKGAVKAAEKVQAATAEGKTINAASKLVNTKGFDEKTFDQVVESITNVGNPAASLSTLTGLVQGVQKNPEIMNNPVEAEKLSKAFSTLEAMATDKIYKKVEAEIIKSEMLKFTGLSNFAEVTPEQQKAFFDDVTTNPSKYEDYNTALDNVVVDYQETAEYKQYQKISEQLDAIYASKANKALASGDITAEQSDQVLRSYGSSPLSFSQDEYKNLISTPTFKNATSETKKTIQAAYRLRKELDSVNDSVVEGGSNKYGNWKGINEYVTRFSNTAKGSNLKLMQAEQARFGQWVTRQKDKLAYWNNLAATKTLSGKQAATRADIATEVALMDKALAFMDSSIANVNAPKSKPVAKATDKKVEPKKQTTPEAKKEPTKTTENTEVNSVIDAAVEKGIITQTQANNMKKSNLSVEAAKNIIKKNPPLDKTKSEQNKTSGLKPTRKTEKTKEKLELVIDESNFNQAVEQLSGLQSKTRGENPSPKAKLISEAILTYAEVTPVIANNPIVLELVELLANPLGADSQKVFEWINKHGSDDHKYMLDKIKDFPTVNQVTKVLLGGILNEGTMGAGYYDNSKKVIAVNPFALIGSPDSTNNKSNNQYLISIVLHEFLHAATYDVIEKSPQIQEQIKELSAEILEYVSSLPKEQQELYSAITYGAEDYQEFLAVLFSDRNQLTLLNDIAKKDKTLFEKILDTVLALFKGYIKQEDIKSDVLLKTLMLADDVFSEAVKAKVSEQSELKPASEAASDSGIPQFDYQEKEPDLDFILAGNVDFEDNGFRRPEDLLGEDSEDSMESFLDTKLKPESSFAVDNGVQVAGTKFSDVFVSSASINNFFLGKDAFDLFEHLHTEGVSQAQVVTKLLEELGLENTPDNIKSANMFVFTASKMAVNLGDTRFNEKSVRDNPMVLLTEENEFGELVLPADLRRMMAIAFTLELSTNFQMQAENRTDDSLRKLLGLPKDSPIDKADKALYTKAGFTFSDVTDSLTNRLFKQIGLGFAKDVDSNMFDLAIQGAALILLDAATITMDSNEAILTTDTIKKSEDSKEELRFFKLNKVPNPELNFGEEVNLNSGYEFGLLSENEAFLEKISGEDNLLSKPTTKKPGRKSIRKFVRSRNVFKKLAEIPRSVINTLARHAQIPNKIFPDMGEVFTTLSEDAQKLIAGVIPDSKLKAMHVNEMDSAISKNESTLRDVSRMRNWINEVKDESFYLLHAMVSNGRVMSEFSYLDPQNSKFSRHMLGAVSSAVEVSTSEKRINPKLTEFKKAVLQAFDAKPDLLTKREINKEFSKILGSQDIQALFDHVNKHGWAMDTVVGLQLLENALYGSSEASYIADGATAGFHALVGLKAYSDALNGSKKFNTTLRYEIDGKTNGTAHALLDWFGASSLEEMKNLMAKVGIYTEGDFSTFAQFKNKGGKDHYEYFADKLTNAFEDVILGAESAEVRMMLLAMGDIIGQKDGKIIISRALAKQPLMTLIYGAGIGSVTGSFVEDVLQQFYNRIAALASMEDKAAAELELKSIKKVIGTFFDAYKNTTKGKVTFPDLLSDLTLESATKWVLDAPAEKALVSAFNTAFYEVFRNGMQDAYGTLMSKRTKALSAAQASFNIFKKVYAKSYAAKVTEINETLDAESQIVFLNKFQEKELIESLVNKLPLIEGYNLNKGKGSDNLTGLVAVKTKRGSELESAMYRQFIGATYMNVDKQGFEVERNLPIEFINNDIFFDNKNLPVTYKNEKTITFTFLDNKGKSQKYEVIYKKPSFMANAKYVKELPNNNTVLDELGFPGVSSSALVARIRHKSRNGGKSERTAQTKGKGTILDQPGPSSIVTTTHEKDSSNQQRMMANGLDFLNVHDAFYTALGLALDSGKDFNRAFLDIHKSDKNIITVHAEMLERMLLIGKEEDVLSNEEFGNLNADLIELQELAQTTQKNKEEFIGLITSVNQFAEIESAYKTGVQGAYSQPLIETLQEPVKTLGSSPKGFNAFTAEETINVNQTNVVKIYDNIDTTQDPVTISAVHERRLSKLVKEMIAPVIQDLKLLVQNTNTATKGKFEVRNGENFVKLQRGTGAPKYFGMTRKEVLAHEFVHAIAEFPLSLPSRYKNRIEELYDVAREFLTPDSLLGKGPHTQAEKNAAQELYDYIFNNQQQTALNPYSNATNLLKRDRLVNNGMHEFIAFGLTNEKVITALQNLFKDNPKAKAKFEAGVPFNRIRSNANSTLFAKAVDFINELFNYFNYKLRAIYNYIDGLDGKGADEALYLLTTKLTYLEGTLGAQELKLNTKIGKSNEMVKRAVVAALTPVAKGIDKVKSMGAENLLELAEKSSSGSVAAMLSFIYNRVDVSKDNFFRNLGTELLGTTPQNAVVRNLLLQSREYIDKARQFVTSNVKTYVNRLFTSDVNEDESASMVRVILELDLVALFNGSTADLLKMINNPLERKAEIDSIEKQLKQLSPKAHNYLINQSKALGFFLVNKQFNINGNGLFNAQQIAELTGLGIKPDFNVNTVTDLVDKLSSLYGLENSDTVDLDRVTEVITRELAEGTDTDNAIQKYLDTHLDIKKEAISRLFDGTETLYRKGYTREQLDPFVGYIVVDAQEAAKHEANKLRVEKVQKDRDDPNQTQMYIVYGETFALEAHQRGVFSTTSEKRKGTNLFQSYSQLDSDDPANVAKANSDIQYLKRKRAVETKAMNKPNYTFTAGRSLTPVYSPTGQVVDYRYEMNPGLKRRVFNKKEMFDESLGHTAAATIDKINTKRVNEKAVRAAHEIYVSEKNINREFIKVGASSKDKEDRDMWYLMPEKARATAKQLFGGDYIMVRKDDYRMWFGQRKANLTTLANWLDKKTQNAIMRQTTDAIGSVLKHRYASIAWDSWVDFVALAKERIVILNTAVLGANIMSNVALLFMAGMVNPQKILSYQLEGYSHLKKYERDHVDMMQTVMALNDRTLSQDKIKSLTARAKILEDRLATNPVAPLIDRGAYQTIIEDVNLLDDTYGYASKLERRFENITNRVPDVVKDIGNTIFMTKATSTNQMLRDAASMSDFAARYALHKHNMLNGMEFEEAFNESMESFITYELPTNIHIQWLNDVGLAMFTKFFIRVQKIIVRRYRKNPLNMLGFHGLDYITTSNISDITDVMLAPTNTLNRFYTPDDLINAVLETNLISFVAK